jgi:hypothetical protein
MILLVFNFFVTIHLKNKIEIKWQLQHKKLIN